MTKEQLKRLRSLISEAEHLGEEIQNLPYLAGGYVADTAKDYRSGYGRTIKIEGYSMENYYRLKSRLQAKQKAILNKVDELELWLDSVEDTEIRRILRMQYIDGLTQDQISEVIGCDVRTIKRKLKKFWNVL